MHVPVDKEQKELLVAKQPPYQAPYSSLTGNEDL
jgi:hypothetical protein